jgi:hypothetical protein
VNLLRDVNVISPNQGETSTTAQRWLPRPRHSPPGQHYNHYRTTDVSGGSRSNRSAPPRLRNYARAWRRLRFLRLSVVITTNVRKMVGMAYPARRLSEAGVLYRWWPSRHSIRNTIPEARIHASACSGDTGLLRHHLLHRRRLPHPRDPHYQQFGLGGSLFRKLVDSAVDYQGDGFTTVSSDSPYSSAYAAQPSIRPGGIYPQGVLSTHKLRPSSNNGSYSYDGDQHMLKVIIPIVMVI